MLPILQGSHDLDDEVWQNTASKGVVGALYNSHQGEEIIYVKDILNALSSITCPQRYVQNNLDGLAFVIDPLYLKWLNYFSFKTTNFPLI